MLLIDYARNEVGPSCRAFFLGQHFGWTTDADKAALMRDAGASVVDVPSRASVVDVPSRDKKPEARKFDGFEIRFFPDTECIEESVAS